MVRAQEGALDSQSPVGNDGTFFIMHFVYILHSTKSDIFYVGQSADVNTRLQFHNHLNPKGFTAKHRPWSLAKSIPFPNQSSAIRAERYIKKRKSRLYIQQLIDQQDIVDNLILRFSSL